MPGVRYLQKIEKYYNDSQKDYEIIWGLKKHHSLHYGFWEKGIKNHAQAVQNQSDKIAHCAHLGPAMLLADLGCGIGGPASFLAQKYQCHISGVSITKRQIKQARDFAAQNNLSHLLDFSVQDFSQTNFPDSHFDVVYAIESSCHALHKEEFLREAYRILKPEGKLVVFDFFAKNQEDEKHKVMQKWAYSWAVDEFANQMAFKTKAFDAGFQNIELRDVTRNVRRDIYRLYLIFLPSYLMDFVLRLTGKRKGKHENMFSALYQFRAYRKKRWIYGHFIATK